jgi:hypothetical protein
MINAVAAFQKAFRGRIKAVELGASPSGDEVESISEDNGS